MSRFWKIVNKAESIPELLVYGELDEWWGDVQSKAFAEALKGIDAEQIRVRINSGGGSVFTAQAIYSSLRNHPAKVEVHIDGIAASAATIIAMAGDKIIMPENAMFMIHNPLSMAFGNAEELRELADLLDKVGETIVATYRAKTGLEDAKLLELMAAETWMTASEALEYGFVDEVSSAMKIAARVREDGGLIINGLTFDASKHRPLPKGWLARVDVKNNNEIPATKEEPEEEVKAMTLDELKEKHPEIYNAIADEARAAGEASERARIQAIEEMAMPGHEELINRAKFEQAVTPEALAVQLIKAEKEAKEKFAHSRARDAAPLNQIQPSAATDELVSEEEKRKPIVNAMAEAINRKNGPRV